MNQTTIRRLRQCLDQMLDNNGPFAMWSRQKNAEKGDFAAVPGWMCDHCEESIWEEPKSICVDQGSGWSDPWGPSPHEYEDECPNCGRLDTCYAYEAESIFHPIKLRRRYVKTITHSINR